MMDLVSFRELYGFQTDASRREVAVLKSSSDAIALSAETPPKISLRRRTQTHPTQPRRQPNERPNE